MVYYSICLVGTYRLHVGLRGQAIALPGSPFTLQVLPGPAAAMSTSLPSDVELPLRGTVGLEDDMGSHLTLRLSDRIGNACDSGGAKVECNCVLGKNEENVMQTQVVDNGDGTYDLVWRSEKSGVYDAQVLIDKEPIYGCPFPIRLLAQAPQISSATISGDGLSQVTAGTPATVTLHLRDQYGNVGLVESSLHFGLTLVRTDEKKEDKQRWKAPETTSDAQQAEIVDEGFRLTYTPERAGDMQLYIWTFDDTVEGSPREQLPDSPFTVFCVAGDAAAAGSHIDGFSKGEAVVETKMSAKQRVLERQSGSAAAVAAQRLEAAQTEAFNTHTMFKSGTPVGAGEILILRPQIHDNFGNPATTTNGELQLELVMPDGATLELDAQCQVKGGLASYEAKYEPRKRGDYLVNITLGDTPIQGSPLAFKVLTGFPDIHKSNFVLPEANPFFSNTLYEIKLITADKYGNRCDRGGAFVVGRLSGPNLPTGQEMDVEVTDCDNGTYVLKVLMRAPCEIKILVTASREKPGAAGVSMPGANNEFPPISMQFVSQKNYELHQEKQKKKAEEEARRRSSLQEMLDGAKGKLSSLASAHDAAATSLRSSSSAAPAPAPAAAGSQRYGTDLLKVADELLTAAAGSMDDMNSMASRLQPSALAPETAPTPPGRLMTRRSSKDMTSTLTPERAKRRLSRASGEVVAAPAPEPNATPPSTDAKAPEEAEVC